MQEIQKVLGRIRICVWCIGFSWFLVQFLQQESSCWGVSSRCNGLSYDLTRLKVFHFCWPEERMSRSLSEFGKQCLYSGKAVSIEISEKYWPHWQIFLKWAKNNLPIRSEKGLTIKSYFKNNILVFKVILLLKNLLRLVFLQDRKFNRFSLNKSYFKIQFL